MSYRRNTSPTFKKKENYITSESSDPQKSFLGTFEKIAESLNIPPELPNTNILFNNPIQKDPPLITEIENTPPIITNTEKVKSSNLTDEEYVNHVLIKFNGKPINNTSQVICDKIDTKTTIINLFKERSSLEIRILNSPLFDISLLKALNDAFNKKLDTFINEELNVN